MGPVGKLGLRLSVIVNTYNNPRALSLVLASLARQTVRDFELLIADDGSGPATRTVVQEFAASAPFAVRHIWHPDEGFRKCQILNKAVCAVAGTYLIFFDGDCLAPARTVENHVRRAERQRYLTGGKVLLSQRCTDALSIAAIQSGQLDRFGLWWREVRKVRRLLISRLPGIRIWFNRNVPRPPAWRGENSSTFTEHVYQVGGFDERFTYGLEDADFGHRLQAAGIWPRSLRYLAPVLHLEHPRPYALSEERGRNRAIFDANRAAKMTVTPYGIRVPMPAADRTD